jgi:hypothetical protein
VQKIWSSNAAFGPIGVALSIAQTAIAVARSVAAIQKINAAKFAEGGLTGPGILPADSTGEKPAGIVHANEYVVPRRLVENPRFRPTLNMLEGFRMRGYADGGLVQAPKIVTFANNLNQAGAQYSANLENRIIEYIKATNERIDRLSVGLSLFDLETEQNRLNNERKAVKYA